MKEQKEIPLVIIGAGPSALTAAIYTTREDVETVLYEKGVVGGLIATADKVENYPGFVDGIDGMQLAEQLGQQAKRFGAQIEYGEVSSIRHDNNRHILTIDGKDVYAKAVLIAVGSEYNKLNIPGESELYGRGVHYCATCDGAFYRDKNIAVVGGGNSAIQESMFLTRFVKHIDLLVRSEIKASKALQSELNKLIDAGKLTVHYGVHLNEIIDKDGQICIKAMKSDEKVSYDVDGVFVFFGLKPNTHFLKDSEIELDEIGLIKTDNNLMTNIPGVFASGDVRSGATMQVASAVGDGATAAISIRRYLEGL